MKSKSRDSILGSLKGTVAPKGKNPPAMKRVPQVVDREAMVTLFSAVVGSMQGKVIRAKGEAALSDALDAVLTDLNPEKAVVSGCPLVLNSGVLEMLGDLNIEILMAGGDPVHHKRACFSADVGITGADFAVAETGSLVILHNDANSRLFSVAPPAHCAIVALDSFIPDMETLAERMSARVLRAHSAASIISGPSSSADICMTPVLGMHGPGKLYVIVVE